MIDGQKVLDLALDLCRTPEPDWGLTVQDSMDWQEAITKRKIGRKLLLLCYVGTPMKWGDLRVRYDLPPTRHVIPHGDYF